MAVKTTGKIPLYSLGNQSEAKMTASTWNESDTAKAEQIWSDYQEQHDLSAYIGKTAGIDANTGRIWIGESIQDVLSQRDADGIGSLLFFERIGSPTYYRKGGRR